MSTPAPDAPTHTADPAARAAATGVPAPLAPRLATWLETGPVALTEEALLAVLRSAPDATPASPPWVAHIGARGDAAAARAEETGDRAAWEEAAFWFFLARFPHLLGPTAADAYRRHVHAVERAGALADRSLQVVRVPVDGTEVVVHLRRPPGVDRPPVVVVTGGIDIWKSDSELLWIIDRLLDAGLATVAVDLPGTGQSPASLDGDVLFSAVLDAVATRDDVDGTRLGWYGMSFGGYWATRVALADRRVRAAVNAGGPVHRTFSPEHVAGLPLGTRLALALTLGTPLADLGADGLTRRLAELSLVTGGRLVPRPGLALLAINGELDELVPVDELAVPAEHGVPQAVLRYPDAAHIATRYLAEHVPFAAGWLRRRL